MNLKIILIGPIGVGKSTLGALLAEALSIPQYPMDHLRWDYYKEIGYEECVQEDIRKTEGFVGVYRYWKPFEAHAVERILEKHEDCVIDFGGGHSVYEDSELFGRVREALSPYKNVILILPSPDLNESIRILKSRGWSGVEDGFDFHEHLIRHPSNYQLAKTIVYTEGKTPEVTRDEILEKIVHE